MEKCRKWINILTIFYLFFNIIYNLFGWIVPIKLVTPESIDSLIYVVMGLMGAGLVALDVLLNPYWHKTKYCWLLYAFVVVMGISTVLNMSFGFMSNVKTIIWTVAQFVLFYSLYQRIGKEKAMKYLAILWKILAVIWVVPVLYSIFQFLVLDSYYTLIWGKQVKQGFVENRLFGVFSDPNYGAVVSLLLIIGMIFLIFRTSKLWKRVVYITYSVLLFIYIVLSGSRTVEIGLVMTAVLYGYSWSENCLKEKQKLLKTLLICVLSAGIVIVAWDGSKIVLEQLPKAASEISVVKEYKEYRKQQVDKNKAKMDKKLRSTAKSKKVLQRKDTKGDNISNNRLQIWQSYLEGMDNHLVFGMSPRNSVQVFVHENPKSYIAQTDYETHNGYLSIFVATGLAGSVLMALFIALHVKDTWKIIFRKEKMEIECLTCILVIVNIAVFTFFFTELFFTNTMLAALFWSILGMLEYWRNGKYENS